MSTCFLLTMHIFHLSGEKNGKGFYIYDSKRKAQPSPDLVTYLEASRKTAGLIRNGQVKLAYNSLSQPDTFSSLLHSHQPLQVSNEDILEMIMFPVVNEACRVMEEGVVVRAADLDIASVMAMGFPPYR